MFSILEAVFERRDAAEAEYETYLTELVAPGHVPTAEEETKLGELRSRKEEFDARVIQINKDAEDATAVEEARKRLGTAAVDVHVTKEPRTYGPESKHSYFMDVIRASTPSMPGYQEAVGRLNQHAKEVAGEMRDPNSAEGKRAARSLRDMHRTDAGPREPDNAVDRAMHYGEQELRAGLDTTAASGGSFVTPQYFVAQYAPFRQFGRVFADQANKMPLPDYGMTIYIPAVSAAAGVAAQANQNSGIDEVDPTAGYLQTALTTNAGQVTVSQQLLDRAGPNFAFDTMVFDQLQRAYNLCLDQYILTTALANAGTVAPTASTIAGTGGLYSFIGKAKAAMVDASGVVLPATHLFFTPIYWEWVASQIDSATPGVGRALIVPDYAGAFNALAAGSDGVPIAEGNTGFKMHGLPVFEDGNIPTASTYNQVIVAHMPEVWFWEGDLVSRVIPQTYAQNLSVLLQVYAYVGSIVRYPKAVQSITSASTLTTNPTF
jgi:HK97 family phage major capsid protein